MTPHQALQLAADVIEANGFHRHYLWNTRQAEAGVAPEFCSVDIAGALAIVLHGAPGMAYTAEVREAEQLLEASLPAPSLAAWYHRRPSKRQVLHLLRDPATHAPAPTA